MRLSITLSFIFLSASLYSQKYYNTFAWSPDSRKIMFAVETFADDKSSFQLMTMNADGTDVKKLADGAWCPAWSKDGRKITYTLKTSAGYEIYVANYDGTQPQQLTKNSWGDMESSFSPDDKQILFTSNRDGKSQIYKMKLDGSQQEKIFPSAEACYSSSWSPKVNLVLYYKDKGDHKDKVYTFDLNTKKESLLTDDSLHNFYPSWTPDGNILFTSTRGSDSDNAGTRLYTMTALGREKKPVSNFLAWFARMSPDGKKIAYSKIEEAGSQLFVANADGSESVCITRK